MNRMSSFPKRRQEGVALIEALLAVVLLAIGLLGTLGLQASAYSAVSEAGMRAEATISAERLLGIMTTDVEHLSDYAMEEDGEPDERLAAWHEATQKSIPGAKVTVVVTPPAAGETLKPTEVIITIGWQRKDDAPANQHTVTAFI